MSAIITITYEGRNFNASRLGTFSLEAFVKEFSDPKVYRNYSPEDRQKLLENAHKKCVEAIAPPKTAVPAGSAKPERPSKEGSK